jgi:hypothetical protein
MKLCIVCHREIDDDVNFCPHCGARQPANNIKPLPPRSQERPIYNEQVRSDGQPVTVLIILAILTICGSLFTIWRATLYDIFGSATQDFGIQVRSTIYILTSFGTITGAIMMLLRKINGLYLYTFCQVLYIVTAIIASTQYDVNESLASTVLFFFVAPAILFLVFYWMEDVRKHLH